MANTPRSTHFFGISAEIFLPTALLLFLWDHDWGAWGTVGLGWACRGQSINHEAGEEGARSKKTKASKKERERDLLTLFCCFFDFSSCCMAELATSHVSKWANVRRQGQESIYNPYNSPGGKQYAVQGERRREGEKREKEKRGRRRQKGAVPDRRMVHSSSRGL